MRSTSPLVTAHLIVDEQVRDIIVMIFESCVSGMTTSEVAQMLNDMGIPSPLEHKRRNGGFYNGWSRKRLESGSRGLFERF